jgi:hypothetical protein
MSVEGESRIGAWLDGVSAPPMPWSGPAARPLRLLESRKNTSRLSYRPGL